MMRLVALLMAATLTACASQVVEESAYNRGVAAYRAKDFATARAERSKASSEGDHTAENNLAYLLYHGLGGTPDQRRAVELWRRAAIAGQSEAQWHLGEAFQEGSAIAQSNAEAYAWYRCAISTAELPGARHSEAEQRIAQDARRSLERLLGLLTKEEFEHGEFLAKKYIASYAKRSET